jgi:hypothetical protein
LGAVAVGTTITNHNMNSTKNANTGLYRLLNIWFIEEAIMDELPPGDVHRLCIGIMKTLSEKERKRYAHPFKMLITDRQWLEKMSQDGYALTIISPHLNKIRDPTRHMNASKIIDVAMIATKDELIIPLTHELMPGAVFGPRFHHAPWFADDVRDKSETKSRFIRIVSNGFTITVVTPVDVAMSAWSAKFLSEKYYGVVMEHTDIYTSVGGNTPNITIHYQHADVNGFREGCARSRRFGDRDSTRARYNSLFAIQSTLSFGDAFESRDGLLRRAVIINIPK